MSRMSGARAGVPLASCCTTLTTRSLSWPLCMHRLVHGPCLSTLTRMCRLLSTHYNFVNLQFYTSAAALVFQLPLMLYYHAGALWRAEHAFNMELVICLLINGCAAGCCMRLSGAARLVRVSRDVMRCHAMPRHGRCATLCYPAPRCNRLSAAVTHFTGSSLPRWMPLSETLH